MHLPQQPDASITTDAARAGRPFNDKLVERQSPMHELRRESEVLPMLTSCLLSGFLTDARLFLL